MSLETLSERASDIASHASDVASDVKSAASDLGSTAQDYVDSGRTAAADKLRAAAKGLHGRVKSATQQAASLGHGAADGLNSAGKYLRKNDVPSMAKDVGALIRKHPVPVMIGAAVLGVLLVKALSSSDDE